MAEDKLSDDCGHPKDGRFFFLLTEDQAKYRSIYGDVLDHKWGCWMISKMPKPE